MTLLDDLRSQEKLDKWSLLLQFWERKLTIAILLPILFVAGVWLFSKTNFLNLTSKIDWLEWLILIIFLSIVFIVWHLSRRPPKIHKNKIGIIIAITAENKKERQRLRTDFVAALKNEIKKGNSQYFEILELSEYHASKINSKESALKYHRVTGGHLIIYGRCKIRNHKGNENYVIEFDASVIHKMIPNDVSQAFGQEIRALIPQQKLFPVSDEMDGFHVTTEMMGVAARYIIGLASLLSGDMITSFDLHVGLWNEVRGAFEADEEITKTYGFLKSKLPNRLAQEGLVLAGFFYRTKYDDYLNRMKKCLDVLNEVDPRNYSAHLLRGIYYFVAERNVLKAKEEIKKSHNERDSAWQFSDAFLTAYDGDLESAHRIYQRAFHGCVTDNTPLEVEIFIRDVLEQEPLKIQLHYCLGMINYFSKGDLSLAKQDFEKFVEEAQRKNVFQPSAKFALKYLDEIEEKLSNIKAGNPQ